MAKDSRIGITGGGGAIRGVNANNSVAALRKSGLEKLAKIGKTTSEAHISYAVRQGKITAKEAAAIDPKKFGVLKNPDVVSSKTITLKKGK